MSAAAANVPDIAKPRPAAINVLNPPITPFLRCTLKRAFRRKAKFRLTINFHHIRAPLTVGAQPASRRSALASQRWRVDVTGWRRHLATGPTQPEHEVVRRKIAEFVGVRDASADAVDGVGDRTVI